ncbi:MAG TPA: hypothetical protein VFH68_15330 [Polyangia bacterium]|nr:hypothetical protein [Polyangia bacterium]
MAPAVQAFVQQAATPAAPKHAPFVHALFGVWTLQPFASFEHVTNVAPLAHVGPAVPVQTGSVLQVQLALPDGPVQL